MHTLQAAAPARRLLRSRRFAHLAGAEAATWLAAYAAPVALAFAVLDAGGSGTDVGIVLGAETAGMAAAVLVGGALADRLPRRRLMASADAAAAVLQVGAVGLLLAGVAPLPWLAGVEALVGVSRGIFYPASTGLVQAAVPAEDRQTANGVLAVAHSSARLAGPPLAGAAVALAGAAAALLVCAGAAAVSAVVLALMPAPAEDGGRPAEPVVRALAEGWREFRAREWLWLTVGWFALLQAVGQGPLLVLGPLVARAALGGAAGWGIVMGAAGAGALAGGLVAVLARPRRPLATGIAAYAATALPLAALAGGLPLAAVAAAAAGGGVAAGFFTATWFTVFQANVPPAAVSRTSAYDWLFSLGALPLGLLAAAPAAAAVGRDAVLLGAAAVTVATSAVVAARPAVARVGAREPARERRPGVRAAHR